MLATDDHRINRHGADGHRAVLDDRLDGIASRSPPVAEVHDRVGPPPLGPAEFFDFFLGAAGRDGLKRPMLALILVSDALPIAHGLQLVAQMDLIGRARSSGPRRPRSRICSPASRCGLAQWRRGFISDGYAARAGLFELRLIPSRHPATRAKSIAVTVRHVRACPACLGELNVYEPSQCGPALGERSRASFPAADRWKDCRPIGWQRSNERSG